jgi:hypothetical protein
MDTYSFGDNSTVIGGPTVGHGKERERVYSKSAHSDPDARPQAIKANFMATDYTTKDKPFFVKIGADGLISALEKLDTQLGNVRIEVTSFAFL